MMLVGLIHPDWPDVGSPLMHPAHGRRCPAEAHPRATSCLCQSWSASWHVGLTLILPHHYGLAQWSLGCVLPWSPSQGLILIHWFAFPAWSWHCSITMTVPGDMGPGVMLAAIPGCVCPVCHTWWLSEIFFRCRLWKSMTYFQIMLFSCFNRNFAKTEWTRRTFF